ncbi:MAG: hypothetical protein IT176_15520 [Acidobacteria bacterium]|nr:hypothetical protein [Acidobacteriota bacterium]
MARTLGWGMIGAAVTMLVRSAARRAMHDSAGTPRLPRAARTAHTFGTMLGLAAAAGAAMALGDVLQEQRRHVAEIA